MCEMDIEYMNVDELAISMIYAGPRLLTSPSHRRDVSCIGMFCIILSWVSTWKLKPVWDTMEMIDISVKLVGPLKILLGVGDS